MGGASDIVTRAVAEFFPKYANGQPLVVQNIGGAAGVTGMNQFLTTRPDGYTLLHFNKAQTIRTLRGGVPFALADFVPIANHVKDANYLLVRTDSPFRTLTDLLDAAVSRRVTIANAGTGGGHHFAALLLEAHTGVRLTHVPYAGGALSATAVLTGEVDASMNVSPEGLSSVDAGQTRILCLFAENRSGVFPNVLTAKEQDVNLVAVQWRGIAVHKDTPKVIIERLDEIFSQIAADPDYQARLRALRFTQAHLGAEDFKILVDREAERIRRIIVQFGIPQ